MLETHNLTFNYPGRLIFRNINLGIKPGGVTVLIGPSGTGKTTLLRCLALLERPQGGEITVDDQKFIYPMLPEAPFSPPWPKLTTVFQQLFLWPHLTLRQNILLPVRRRNKQVNREELDELIDAFDMGEFIDNYPNEASLGQRQRIALARAIMLHPRYLLLDEITSALDVEQIAKILAFLKGGCAAKRSAFSSSPTCLASRATRRIRWCLWRTAKSRSKAVRKFLKIRRPSACNNFYR
jgi:ABC-type polar amino acid transport system ATPase subunit